MLCGGGCPHSSSKFDSKFIWFRRRIRLWPGIACSAGRRGSGRRVRTRGRRPPARRGGGGGHPATVPTTADTGRYARETKVCEVILTTPINQPASRPRPSAAALRSSAPNTCQRAYSCSGDHPCSCRPKAHLGSSAPGGRAGSTSQTRRPAHKVTATAYSCNPYG